MRIGNGRPTLAPRPQPPAARRTPHAARRAAPVPILGLLAGAIAVRSPPCMPLHVDVANWKATVTHRGTRRPVEPLTARACAW